MELITTEKFKKISEEIACAIDHSDVTEAFKDLGYGFEIDCTDFSKPGKIVITGWDDEEDEGVEIILKITKIKYGPNVLKMGSK